MPPITMRERAASRFPGSFGASMEGAKANNIIRVPGADLEAAVEQIIGNVKRGVDGRLNRTLPKRHPRPRFGKSLYAERITGVEGLGTGEPIPSTWTDNTLDAYTGFDVANVSTEFIPFRYQILPDADITQAGIVWTDADGTTRHSQITTEWRRFVERQGSFKTDMLTATKGEMTIVDSAATLVPKAGGPLHGYAFAGKPRLPIRTRVFTLIWHNIPSFYVWHIKSPFFIWAERVNLNAIWGFEPGELLYRGCTGWKEYPAWDPDLAADDADINGTMPGGIEMLCDVSLSFEARERITVTGPPNAGNRLFRSPFNAAPNFINKQWNSIVLIDPTDKNNTAKWYPPYDAFPVDLLFTDPDFVDMPARL